MGLITKVNEGECSVGKQNGHHKEDVHTGKLNLAKYTVAEVSGMRSGWT